MLRVEELAVVQVGLDGMLVKGYWEKSKDDAKEKLQVRYAQLIFEKHLLQA